MTISPAGISMVMLSTAGLRLRVVSLRHAVEQDPCAAGALRLQTRIPLGTVRRVTKFNTVSKMTANIRMPTVAATMELVALAPPMRDMPEKM